MADHGVWLWARWFSPTLHLEVEHVAVAGSGEDDQVVLLASIGEAHASALPTAPILDEEKLRPGARWQQVESDVGPIEIGPLTYDGDDGVWTVHMIHLEQPSILEIFDEGSPDFGDYSTDVWEAFSEELDVVHDLLTAKVIEARALVRPPVKVALARGIQASPSGLDQTRRSQPQPQPQVVEQTWLDTHPAFVPLAFAALFAVVGAGPLAIGYYDFLRAVLMGAGIFVVVHSALSKRWGWMVLGIALVVVWAPVTPLHLPATTWKVLDVVAAVLLLVAALLIPASSDKEGQSIRWWKIAIVPFVVTLLFWSAISGSGAAGPSTCYPDPRGTFCE